MIFCVLIGRVPAIKAYTGAFDLFAVFEEPVRFQHLTDELHAVSLYLVEVYKALASLGQDVFYAMSELRRVLL